MSRRRVKDWVGVFLLAALDGLVFGVLVEWLRRLATPILADYYIAQELKERGYVPAMTTLLGGYVDIPLLTTLVFAIVIPSAYFYLRKRVQSEVVLWQLLGIAATTVVVPIHALLNPFGHNTWLLAPIWRWALCLPLISFLNLVFGLLVQGVRKITFLQRNTIAQPSECP